MGIACKPVGKMRSIMKKLDNEILKIAQEEKKKKEKKKKEKKDGNGGKESR